MSSTYFVQECPVCGRPVQIRVVHRGRQVNCQHCGGQFVACDPANRRDLVLETHPGILDRAQQLLEQSAIRLAALRGVA